MRICPRHSSHTAGFLNVNIQHVEYLRFAIRAPSMFFRVDSVTLNTPPTTGQSDKIIFRSTKIIGTLLRIVERGEIVPKWARLSCGVYPALAESALAWMGRLLCFAASFFFANLMHHDLSDLTQTYAHIGNEARSFQRKHTFCLHCSLHSLWE